MRIQPKTRSEWVRLAAAVIFALSFIPPGISAFCRTPGYAVSCFSDASEFGEVHNAFLGIALAIGWLSNFTVFLRPPRVVSIVAMASPWILYLGMLFLSYNRGVKTEWPDTWVVTFVPFYPWAFGIGLIHLSWLMEPVPKDDPRTPWTGF